MEYVQVFFSAEKILIFIRYYFKTGFVLSTDKKKNNNNSSNRNFFLRWIY